MIEDETTGPDTGPDEGVDGIAAMIADADVPDSQLTIGARQDPMPGDPYQGIAPGEWGMEADELGLPPGCPVIPLGFDGDEYWFLDVTGQLRSRHYKDFSINSIGSLFHGRELFLHWAWPKKNADGVVTSWRAEKASERMRAACARKGAWSMLERARGRGAWLLADGRLVIHCGTRLFLDGDEDLLGEFDGNVYMTRPPVPTPWPTTLEDKQGPARKLLPLLRTWNWARPDIDPILFLGWQGAARIGGALKWRPSIFMIGDKSTGKSTLHDVMRFLHGEGLIQSGDSTAAGIYQRLKADALPVAVDEIEGKSDNRRAKAVIELARVAASGALILRGGDRHQGTNFYARSCFAFSSINTPPLEPQDLSRMALLRLKKLKDDQEQPIIDEEELGRIGRMITRRMIDNWYRFEGTLKAYRAALADAGHDSRGQDTFGTLLACADLIIDCDGEALELPMGPDAEDLRFWTEKFDAAEMFEFEDAGENWRRCLDELVSKRVEAWRSGSRQTVGQVLLAFRRGGEDGLTMSEANGWLEQAGIKLQKPENAGEEFSVFIPNQHSLLQELFKETTWFGERGSGVWTGALRQAPEELYALKSANLAGRKCKGTAFPVSVVLNEDENE